MSDEKRHAYALQRGGEVPIQAVSQYDVVDVLNVARKDFEEKHGELRRPTFTIELGGGPLGSAGTQTIAYDDTTIKDAPEEDRELWRAYKRLSNLWREAAFEATARVLLCDGLLISPPEDRAWEEKYKRRNIPIPEDPDDYKVFWIERQVILNPLELLGLVTAIQELATAEVNRAAQAAAETFQDSVGKS